MGEQRNRGVTIKWEAICPHLLLVRGFLMTMEVDRSAHALEDIGCAVSKAAQPENLRYGSSFLHRLL